MSDQFFDNPMDREIYEAGLPKLSVLRSGQLRITTAQGTADVSVLSVSDMNLEGELELGVTEFRYLSDTVNLIRFTAQGPKLMFVRSGMVGLVLVWASKDCKVEFVPMG